MRAVLQNGALICSPFDKKMIVVAPAGKEEMHIHSLVNAGFKNVAGYLEDGFEAWQSSGLPIDMIIDVDAGELAMDLPFSLKRL